MTLKELKQNMSCPKTVKVPTAKELRTMGAAIIAQVSLEGGCMMTAYQNGYVLYTNGKRYTVISAFVNGSYVYGMEEAACEIDESYFEEQNWYVRLLLEAEDRIEKNHYKRTHCVSIDAESENWGEIATTGNAEKEYLKKEAMEELFSLLTERQKLIVSMYYFQGETMENIGSLLGITKQSVNDSLKRAIKRCREKLGNSFAEVFAN